MCLHERSLKRPQDAQCIAVEHRTVDVVVVGGGPAGLATSSLFAGWIPYYMGNSKDQALHTRLNIQGAKPLVDMDLSSLIAGLEGRSNNPIALLYDHLFHPGADSAFSDPYATTLRFRHCPERAVSHLVLDSGDGVGGSWRAMAGETVTLSPAYWMELPGYRLCHYAEDYCQDLMSELDQRVGRNHILDYYQRYATEMDLKRNIRTNTTVNSVVRNPQGESWLVKATETDARGHQVEVQIIARRAVVLAVGMFGVPRSLGIPGEDGPIVTHRIPAHWEGTGKTVVVVGAGLSASDCCVYAMRSGWRVVHVFRGSPQDSNLGKKFSMPDPRYDEYYRLVQLMAGHMTSSQYEGHSASKLVAIDQSGACTIQAANGSTSVVKADRVAILIGSHPDLSFLKTPLVHANGVNDIDSAATLNRKATHEVYLDVDPLTLEVKGCEGLYALGPLRGDNFVRFVVGDAVGVYAHLYGSNQCNPELEIAGAV